jgi:hypothetical protein
LSGFAIAFGDAVSMNNIAVAQQVSDARTSSVKKDIGSVARRLTFDEFWHGILSILQENDGFVEKEDVERVFGVDMQDTTRSASRDKSALTDVLGRLRVEWILYRFSTPFMRAANARATPQSIVKIDWYETTFDDFYADARNEEMERDLHKASFWWRPPMPHSHGGVTPGYFVRTREGQVSSLQFSIKPPFGHYTIQFTGTARAEPEK